MALFSGLLPLWWSKQKPHRIERWRAHSTVRGTFRIALAAGDGAKHHRNCRDFLSARHVLLINQTITLIFAVLISILSLFISIQLYREEVVEDDKRREQSDTLGVEFAAMAALGLFIAFSMALGIAATATLHLGHLGLFLWLILCIIPLLLLFALVLTDLNFVFRSYIQHNWESNSLNVLRKGVCDRSWRKRCRAPIRAPPGFSSITDWCRRNFNDRTDCESLRREGTREAWDIVRFTTVSLAAVAWAEAALLIWCVRLVCIIVTVPIVLDSAPRFYIYVLVPVAVPILFVGIDFRTHASVKVESSVRTIGHLLIAAGVVMAVSVLVGRLAALARSAKAMLLFIVHVLAVLVLCVVTTSLSVTSFFTLKEELQSRKDDRDDLDELACEIDLYGCSGCDLDPPQCREWSVSEIVKYAQAYVKFGGFLAIVSSPPFIAALYVAVTLFISYRDYQSAYV